MALAQTGDPDAFSELYTQHKKCVFSICLRMVHAFSLAEDLTQETFLQLHRKLASFRGDSLFTTWLHRMTVNIVLMCLRRRVLPVVSLEDEMTDSPEYVARSFGTSDRTQVGVVDRVAIECAVATLAADHRNIFLLHDVYGFRHDEIEKRKDYGHDKKTRVDRAFGTRRSIWILWCVQLGVSMSATISQR